MKYIIFILSFLLLSQICFSDQLIIPFSCYPYELQEKFAKHGRKLDLDRNARTRDSWAFLENRGQEFRIFTYFPATSEDFEIILKLAMERKDG